jgi:LuxR family maltose regulon positive regulatory protein
MCQFLSSFPDDVVVADAELALAFATARLLEQQLEHGAAYVDLAERHADAVERERRPRFDVLLAVLRLVLARWRGDLDRA